jgi:hypothetical protein
MATAREISLTLLGFAVTIVIGAWQVFDARSDTDRVTQALQSKEDDLNKAQADNDALMIVSLPGFLQKYDAHIDLLKRASDVYEKAKGAKGVNISGSEAANALTRAEDELYEVTDSFTDYIQRWREVAKTLNNLLDGNVTELENSRRENNPDDVDAMARRIVRAAPDLATPLRVALDKLKPPSNK